MSAQHTPGPWAYEPDEWTPEGGVDEIVGWNIVSSSGEIVGCEGILHDGLDNARLIAAAPELLEACQALMRYDAGDQEDDVKLMLDYAEAVNAARAAIAKATGSAA